MSSQQVEVLVVGAGQAGIAMSEHLGLLGVPHLVVERDRIAERWRSWRWDSLVANGPAWHDRFPNQEFNTDPDGFATKEEIADYFVTYAEKIDAPIRTGVAVHSVRKNTGRPGFCVETSDGMIEARFVVAATGAFQKPIIPPVVPDSSGIRQMHSSSYRNPDQLPAGSVLVVGAGSSGVQIADELQQSGRQVYLAVGPHDRPPRSYRGRDFCWWLGVLGKWDASAPPRGAEHVTIAVSGAHGGNTVDFRNLASSGITLLGMAGPFDNGVMRFADDLRTNIENGDSNYLSMLDEADAFIARNGIDLPEEPEARVLGPDPECMTEPHRRTRPARRRSQLDHLGGGLRVRLRLAAGRRVRRERKTATPARRFIRARGVFPRPTLAVTARIELHLGCMARRQIPRRPDRHPAKLSRLQDLKGHVAE